MKSERLTTSTISVITPPFHRPLSTVEEWGVSVAVRLLRQANGPTSHPPGYWPCSWPSATGVHCCRSPGATSISIWTIAKWWSCWVSTSGRWKGRQPNGENPRFGAKFTKAQQTTTTIQPNQTNKPTKTKYGQITPGYYERKEEFLMMLKESGMGDEMKLIFF